MAKDKLIVENRQPKVGIFWFLGDQIVSFEAEVKKVPPVGGFRDSPWDHWQEWPKVQAANPALRNKEYVDVPRGRVIYSDKDKTFHIVTSRAISGDVGKVARIKRTFSLPLMTKLVTDPHYEDSFDLEDDED